MIRPAVETDSEAIAEVHVTSRRAAYAGIVPQQALDILTPQQMLDRWLHLLATEPGFAATARRWVAELNSSIVGFTSIGPARTTDPPSPIELFAIHLLPEAQGRGLGRALIEAATTHLRSINQSAVHLWVLQDNTRARAFYEHIGWTSDGATRAYPLSGGDVLEARYLFRLT